jgi:hypothetical protein
MSLKIYTRQAMYGEWNIDALSCNYCCRGKARSITDSECMFVVLVVQHEKCMRSITLSCVTYPAVQYFPTLSQKRRYFRGKKKLSNKKRAFCCLYTFV